LRSREATKETQGTTDTTVAVRHGECEMSRKFVLGKHGLDCAEALGVSAQALAWLGRHLIRAVFEVI